MVELIIGWGCIFVVLWVILRAVNHRRNRAEAPGDTLLVWLRIISVGLAFSLHIVLTSMLYEPVMELLDIDTSGFMNLNGLATFAVIWSAIALLLFWSITKAEPLFGIYHNPLRVAYLVFLALPFAIVFLFLFVSGLK